MSQDTLLQQNVTAAASTGWRLNLFQAYNWGAYHHRIANLSAEGNFAVLTGTNGAGKTTLLDGILCLLVPSHLRKFNAAATSNSRSDRDVEKYRMGTYDSTQDANGNTIDQSLRQKHEWSFLLARFSLTEGSLLRDITLVHAYGPDKACFRFIGGIPFDLKVLETQKLNAKSIPQLFTSAGFTEFPAEAYYQQVRNRLGMQHERVAALFAQLIALKGFEDVGAFFCNYVLSPNTPVINELRKLQSSYSRVKNLHEAILRDESALNFLIPVREAAKNFNTKEAARDFHQALVQWQPSACKSLQRQFLVSEKNKLDAEVAGLHTQLQTAFDALRTSEEHERISYSAHAKLGSPLEMLRNQRKDLKRELDSRKQALDSAQMVLAKANIQVNSLTREAWASIQKDANQKAEELQSQTKTKNDSHRQLAAKFSTLEKRVKELEEQETQLSVSGVAISPPLLAIRKLIIQQLGGTEEEFPFVGELIKLAQGEEIWMDAIERLLSSTSKTLLVPAARLQEVDAWANIFQKECRRELRLSFRAAESNTSGPSRWEADSIGSKLEFRNHDYKGWVANLIQDRFPHKCVPDTKAFSQHKKAITPAGLVLDGPVRHLNTYRCEYCMGWDGRVRAEQIKQELATLKPQKEQMLQALIKLESERDTTQHQITELRKIPTISWEKIDTNSIQTQLAQLDKQEQELLDGNQELQKLEADWQASKEAVEAARKAHRELDPQLTESQRRLDEVNQRLILLPDSEEEAPEALGEAGKNQLEDWRNQFLSASGWEEAQALYHAIEKSCIEGLSKAKQELAYQENTLNGCIARYLDEAPHEKSNYATVERRSLYTIRAELVTKANELETNGLPKLRKDFVDLFDHALVDALRSFLLTRTKYDKDIHNEIAGINNTLKLLPLDAAMRIEVHMTRKNQPLVSQFKVLADQCLANLTSDIPEDPDVTGSRYRALVTRYKQMDELLQSIADTEQADSRRILDPRLWYTYCINEVYISTGQPKRHLTNTSALSTGEQKRLAYALVAATAHHHYGISTSPNSFRFVCLDEMLGTLGDDYAREALGYFHNMGLQLLVVHPLDAKLGVLVGLVEHVNFAQRKPNELVSTLDVIKPE